MKGSVARWLCRFFFVISVDAPRHALGRDELFFSARNRTGPAFVLQNEPFQDFVVILAQYNDQTARKVPHGGSAGSFFVISVDASRRTLGRGELFSRFLVTFFAKK